MKTTIFILLISLSLCTNEVNAANKDTLFLKDVYKTSSNYLISERILNFDSIKSVDLMTKFENWGGQNFTNYNEVKTGKTNEQITLTYITSSFGLLNYYVNLIIEFKDNKIRIRAYDDGNVFLPGSYAGGVVVPAIQSRSLHLKSYFEDDMIIYKPTPGAFNHKEKWASGVIQYKQDIENTITSIDTYIKSNLNSETKSDW
jgi:hypothetical protein